MSSALRVMYHDGESSGTIACIHYLTFRTRHTLLRCYIVFVTAFILVLVTESAPNHYQVSLSQI